ncbi:MAG: hypothetical protein K0S18_154 [Anaerocolumna sp.]|nr:hypothetical protein [Anaerocolumna sp.]
MQTVNKPLTVIKIILYGGISMASIEFITKRIQGKQKEIEKLNKKLERIQKAKQSNWQVNPYYYSEYDLNSTEKELNYCIKQLDELQNDLQTANEKANSRNVLAITQFLDAWLQRNIEFYTAEKEKYNIALQDYYQHDRDYCNWFNSKRHDTTKEERNEIEKNHKEYRKTFQTSWRHITQFDHGEKEWHETMISDLKQEYNRKYDYIIEKTNEIVGTITDASYLTVDTNDNLNGYIIGTRGKASVNTIGAGGYNIQCYHFRTLIHEIK